MSGALFKLQDKMVYFSVKKENVPLAKVDYSRQIAQKYIWQVEMGRTKYALHNGLAALLMNGTNLLTIVEYLTFYFLASNLE